MSLDQLVGVWNLVSFHRTSPDGETTPWGEAVHGMLIYTRSGYMSAALNKAIKPDSNPHRASTKAILFYSGTFTFDGHTVIHHVKNASYQPRIGRDEVRQVTWSGKQMTLKAEGDFGLASLRWEKIADQ